MSAEEWEKAAAKALSRVAKGSDAVERARLANRELALVDQVVVQALAQARLEAVAELRRAKLSYGFIASALGVGEARAAQLSKEAVRRGLAPPADAPQRKRG